MGHGVDGEKRVFTCQGLAQQIEETRQQVTGKWSSEGTSRHDAESSGFVLSLVTVMTVMLWQLLAELYHLPATLNL